MWRVCPILLAFVKDNEMHVMVVFFLILWSCERVDSVNITFKWKRFTQNVIRSTLMPKIKLQKSKDGKRDVE